MRPEQRREIRAVLSSVRKADEEAAYHELALRAYKMRQSGEDWVSIAEKCGISINEARTLVGDAIAQASALVGDGTRVQVLEMELSRLDVLQKSLWQQAVEGDTRSVETVLKVMHARARLLGLDELSTQNSQAAATTVVIASGSNEEYVAALKQIVDRPREDDE